MVDCLRGHAYQRAVTLARKEAADLVGEVEGAWGAWLAAQGRHGEAIKHYSAAGLVEAAVEAAAASRNWDTAAGLLQSMVRLQLPVSTALLFYTSLALRLGVNQKCMYVCIIEGLCIWVSEWIRIASFFGGGTKGDRIGNADTLARPECSVPHPFVNVPPPKEIAMNE